jgi:hypothetical protein
MSLQQTVCCTSCISNRAVNKLFPAHDVYVSMVDHLVNSESVGMPPREHAFPMAQIFSSRPRRLSGLQHFVFLRDKGRLLLRRLQTRDWHHSAETASFLRPILHPLGKNAGARNYPRSNAHIFLLQDLQGNNAAFTAWQKKTRSGWTQRGTKFTIDNKRKLQLFGFLCSRKKLLLIL